jgi:site-specific recombinase XerD
MFNNEMIQVGGELAPLDYVPQVVARHSQRAAIRFLTFFTDTIRNANTRTAYHRNACQFFLWCEQRGLDFDRIKSFHISAYIEGLLGCRAKSSVKQHLASLRMLYDWLVVGQIVAVNPAHAVRGPRLVVKKGKTPVLTEDQAKQLLGAIDTTNVVGLRDRALIALLGLTFARIDAAVQMDVKDYYINGTRRWIRLHEKGGKEHEMPAHHKLEEYMGAYLTGAAIGEAKDTPLFRTTRGRSKKLTGNRLHRTNAWQMVRRRARHAGIDIPIGCHTFRATGITNFIQNGGELKEAQKMAAHESPRTTGLYDRTGDQITLDEIERVTLF